MRSAVAGWLWALAAVAVLALGLTAQSADYTWTTGTSNSWSSNKWTLAGVPNSGPPGAADNATISVNGVSSVPYTVTVDDARTINNATLSNGFATLRIAGGGGLTVNGAFALNNGGKLDNAGGGLTLNGAFNWHAGTVSEGTVTASNGGAVTNGGIIDGTTTALTFSGGTWAWSNGFIQLHNGGTFNIGAAATVTASGSDGFSSPAGQTGTVNNAGVLQITNGSDSRVNTGVTLNNTGTFRVTGNGGSWNLEGGTVNNAGVIDIGAGAAIDINGGQLHLNAGTTVTGAGMILLEAASANNRLAVNADVTTAGGLKIVRGVFDGAGSIAVAGSLDLQMFSAAAAVNTTVYANGGGNWTSGTVRIGSGSVNVNGGTANWSGSTREIEREASAICFVSLVLIAVGTVLALCRRRYRYAAATAVTFSVLVTLSCQPWFCPHSCLVPVGANADGWHCHDIWELGHHH